VEGGTGVGSGCGESESIAAAWWWMDDMGNGCC